MTLCDTICSHGNCMKVLYNDVSDVRNSYLKMLGLYKQNFPFARFFINSTQKNLDVWDDLAEDCLIASDLEIRGLINQIADKA